MKKYFSLIEISPFMSKTVIATYNAMHFSERNFPMKFPKQKPHQKIKINSPCTNNRTSILPCGLLFGNELG
jgi:hypothetical protein